ncbi:hypothetical protein [Nocardioides sp.]|uniref:hypothetical protein n=1 Tax=Nocardioides sp. TaxID=35761 RepID=UPI001A1E8352|nr:hypothetical protein [Nocardioides sp.]MBJ7357072.1 hypothetical protein [Nocardioides sp.]
MAEVLTRSASHEARLARIAEAIKRVDASADGALLHKLASESLGLWWDVISEGSRAPAPAETITEPTNDVVAFADLLDLSVVDASILNFGRIDLDARGAQEHVWKWLGTLSELIWRASRDRYAPGEPLIFLDGGEGVDPAPYVSGWNARIGILREGLRCLVVVRELEEAAEAASQAAKDAQVDVQTTTTRLAELRDELVKARTERAQHELSDHFKRLSWRERCASWLFRVLTFTALAGAVYAGAEVPAGIDLESGLGHLAIILALGGGAAYASRLASTHRSMADWAKSIQVQLNTFQDFLTTVTDDPAKARIYEEFARRVLGAPPSLLGGSDTGAGLSNAQVLDLAALITGKKP